MIRTHRLQLPLTRDAVRELRVGDLVTLSGEIVLTAGLPTHARIREAIAGARELPFALAGGTLFHLGSYSEDSGEGFRVRYMNPTTSTRFNAFMPDFISALDLRLVGGKGGLDDRSAAAMRETGCAYLSFLGGGCQLLSAAIERVVEVGWSDLVAHYRLVKVAVRDLGPLTVAIDAHGESLYARLRKRADERLPELMAALARDREKL
jgi:fumarate hydratase subunit beta